MTSTRREVMASGSVAVGLQDSADDAAHGAGSGIAVGAFDLVGAEEASEVDAGFEGFLLGDHVSFAQGLGSGLGAQRGCVLELPIDPAAVVRTRVDGGVEDLGGGVRLGADGLLLDDGKLLLRKFLRCATHLLQFINVGMLEELAAAFYVVLGNAGTGERAKDGVRDRGCGGIGGLGIGHVDLVADVNDRRICVRGRPNHGIDGDGALLGAGF